MIIACAFFTLHSNNHFICSISLETPLICWNNNNRQMRRCGERTLLRISLGSEKTPCLPQFPTINIIINSININFSSGYLQ